MPNRIVDIRLVITDGNEADKDIPVILEKIKTIVGTNSGTELLKGCIRKAYEYYYKNLEKKPK
jgi:hypothetical protein